MESERTSDPWSRIFTGAVLILAGGSLLLNRLGYRVPLPDNWWALLVLAVAVSSFLKSLGHYRRDGFFSRAARSAFLGGLALTLTAAVFLFDWDWDKVWPLFLVAAGVSTIIFPRGRSAHPSDAGESFDGPKC